MYAKGKKKLGLEVRMRHLTASSERPASSMWREREDHCSMYLLFFRDLPLEPQHDSTETRHYLEDRDTSKVSAGWFRNRETGSRSGGYAAAERKRGDPDRPL